MTEILLAILSLVVGFILLIKGADFFVDGSSSVAKKLRVSSMIIGLTIVAMGTSLPECAVSITASLEGNNGLAVSNVTGSNIFNLMMVCGICSLFMPLTVQKETLKKEFPFSVVCTILFAVLSFVGMIIGRLDGFIFCTIFIAYLLWMIYSAKKNPVTDDDDKIKILPVWKSILFILGGAIAVKFGGDFVVNGASTIAKAIGWSDTLIGLTIVAMGTSLPELVTSIIAAKKGDVDMAIGNVIGSNIFNILLVLGVSSVISPVALITENIVDIAVLIAFTLITYAFCITEKKISRIEGAVMVCLYAGYTAYAIIR